ncbi:MAG: glycosyltransferase family 4 protein, partial [Bacteroidetes bacterium]|nr:glycosyltransferase family 4 protein [Fibrella sp.]
MRILFITPTGGLTGSEMMLWYLLRQLSTRGYEVGFFSMQRGRLHQLAGDVSFKTAFFNQKRGFIPDFYEGLYKKAFAKLPAEEALLRFHDEFKPDLWYLNTITMPQTAVMARSLNIPYVVHFHELLSSLDEHPAASFGQMLTGASRLIGCSEKVCQRIRQMGHQNVSLLYSCIDTDRIQVNHNLNLRAQLNIPQDAFIWLMSGTASLRKGFDLIPDIVEHLPPNTYFLWLGKDKNSALTAYVR